MPVNNPAAYGLQPFNAANTLALATDIKGARTQNALQQLLLQREQDPESFVNRAREVGVQAEEAGLNVVREQLEQARMANAVPQIRSVLNAIGQVKETIADRGVAAGRQRLSERISFLQTQGVLPEEFDVGIDLDSMSDEEFIRGLEEEEQDLIGTLNSIQPPVESRTSAAIGDMQALGIPLTPEGFKQYNEARGGGAEGLEALIAEANLRGVLIEQEVSAQERRREAEARTKERRGKVSAIKSGIKQAQKIAGITRELEGTFVQPGVGASTRRDIADFTSWLGGVTGFDTEGLSEQVSNFDVARKGMEQQVASLLERGDLGEATDAKLRQAQQRMANPNISPGAILEIQAQVAEALLQEADAEGFEVPNRSEVEASIDRMRGLAAAAPIVDVPGAVDAASASVADVARMTVDQLRSLDISQMSDEALEAAERRWEELNAE